MTKFLCLLLTHLFRCLRSIRSLVHKHQGFKEVIVILIYKIIHNIIINLNL